MLLASAGMAYADESGAAPALDEAGSMENFVRSLVYEDQFADVADTAWYSQHVKDAYEYGFVSGNSETTYNPDSEITVAEAIVIACQLHSIYYDETFDRYDVEEGDPWYQPYVDYAIEHGIIWSNYPYSLTSKATRSIFAGIMANALPDDELDAIGTVTNIPDVTDQVHFSASIYQLYNAGVLSGKDEYGYFHPYDTIKRSEVAVVVLNLADEARRKAPVSVPAGSSAETILNAATLTPMKTNNAELDGIIDGIFAQIITDDMSTYQKTKAIYDYLMDNCYYGNGWASWSGKYVKHDDDYVVVMGKTILKTGHGTCDNYSAAFVAMARRIGLNAYFARGYAGNQAGYLDTHEIAIVSIAGVDYVFDPQTDDYNSRPGRRTYSLFCKPFATQTGRYKGYDLTAAKAGFGNFQLK